MSIERMACARGVPGKAMVQAAQADESSTAAHTATTANNSDARFIMCSFVKVMLTNMFWTKVKSKSRANALSKIDLVKDTP